MLMLSSFWYFLKVATMPVSYVYSVFNLGKIMSSCLGTHADHCRTANEMYITDVSCSAPAVKYVGLPGHPMFDVCSFWRPERCHHNCAEHLTEATFVLPSDVAKDPMPPLSESPDHLRANNHCCTHKWCFDTNFNLARRCLPASLSLEWRREFQSYT